MSVRAGVVVTGTEVLAGRVADRNGPWLADRLLDLGIELAHITICGDRPQDLEAQLRFLAGERVELLITSGGLGPTADDLTLAGVARFTGRPLALDAGLEQRIAEILRPLMARWPGLDADAVQAANHKQALVPAGATVLEPAGTAPGVVIPPSDGLPPIVVLPGPPRELQAMWQAAIASEPLRGAIGRGAGFRVRTLRLFGIPESEIAETLRRAGQSLGALDALEVTTCLRRGEVEVVVRYEPDFEAEWVALRNLVAQRHPDTLFSSDGSTVDDQVAQLLCAQDRTVVTAESCTGGLLAARLTERAGASSRVAGGVVTYADGAKAELLGVDPGLIQRHGAVSPEVARTMALGALERYGADVAVAITGIAGPGGGSEEKPAGTVCWCALARDGAELALRTVLPGDRAEVRDRSTTVAMHLLRRLLRGERGPS